MRLTVGILRRLSSALRRSRAPPASLTRSCCEHIAFAQDQIRGFAQAQRATLTDLEIETLPGVTLGHRHIPVRRVGAYVPGGRYPMLASSFMTRSCPRSPASNRSSPARRRSGGGGIHPAMLYAMRDLRRRRSPVSRRRPGARGDGLRHRGSRPVDMLVGAGNAYVAEAKRQLFGRVGIDLLAGPTEIARDRRRVRRPRAGRGRPARPGRARADLPGRPDHDFGRLSAERCSTQSSELLESWPTRDIAGAGVARPRLDRHRRRPRRGDRVADERARAPRGPGRARTSSTVSRAPAQLRLAVPRRAGNRRLRRQGRSAPTTCCRRGAPRATPAGCGSASSSRPAPTSALTDRGHASDRADDRGDLRGRALRGARAHRDDAPRPNRAQVSA